MKGNFVKHLYDRGAGSKRRGRKAVTSAVPLRRSLRIVALQEPPHASTAREEPSPANVERPPRPAVQTVEGNSRPTVRNLTSEKGRHFGNGGLLASNELQQGRTTPSPDRYPAVGINTLRRMSACNEPPHASEAPQ